MANLIGRLVKVGVAKEASRGVGAAPVLWIPQTSVGLRAATEEARVEGALGSISDSDDKLVVEKYAEGELGGEMRSQSIGYLLYNLFGSVSSSGSGDYTHAFSLSETNNHQSLALVVKDDNLDEMYRLSMINSLGISVELGGLVMFSADVMAKSPVTTSSTYSAPTDYLFSKKHVHVKVAADLASLDAATELELKTLELTFNKNVERDSAIGTAEPVDFFNKQFAVEGSLSLNFVDNTFRDYMLNGTKRAMRIDIDNADETISGGSLSPRLRIELPSVDFSGWEPDRSLNEILKQSINFKANYDTTNGIVSTCDLRNGKASY